MGWQDAPVIGKASSGGWQDAPVISGAGGLAPTAAAPESPSGVQQFIRGVRELPQAIIDAPSTLVSSLVAPVIGSAAGAARSLWSSNRGTPAGVAEGQQTREAVTQALTYEPRSAAIRSAKTIVGVLAEPVMPALMAFGLGPEVNALAQGAKGAATLTEAGGNRLRQIQANRAAPALEREIVKSRLAQPTREVVDLARSAGIKLDPAAVNPTTGNRVMQALGGKEETAQTLSMQNVPVVNSMSKADLALPADKPITAEAIQAKRAEAAAPYQELEAVPEFQMGPQFRAAVSAANPFRQVMDDLLGVLGGKSTVKLTDTFAGRDTLSGPEAVMSMQSLRKIANDVDAAIAKGTHVELKKVEAARAAKDVARAIEDEVTRNLEVMDRQAPGQGYGDLAQRFVAGRQYIAKSHNYERALDSHGNIDATILGKRVKEGKVVQGPMEVIARVGEMFPDAVTIPEGGVPYFPKNFARRLALTGPGAVGYALGGLPGAVGATLAWPEVGAMARRKIASPAYQANQARVPDFRSAREQLGYNHLAPPPEPLNAMASGPVPRLFDQPPVAPIPGSQISLAPAAEQRTPFPIITGDPKLALRVRQLQGEKGVLGDLAMAFDAPLPDLLPEMQPQATPVIPGTQLSLVAENGKRTPFPVLENDVNALNRVGKLQGEPGSSLSLGNAPVSEPLVPIPVEQAYSYGKKKSQLIAREVSDLMELTTPPDAAGKRVKFKTIDMPLRQELWQQPQVVKAMEAFKEEAQYLNEILGDKATDVKLRAEATKELRRMKTGLTDLVSAYGVNAKDAKAHGLRRPLYQTSRNRLAR